MIALDNLRAKTETLKSRIGSLAMEKLTALDRIAAIDEETKQVALVVQAFDVIAADLEKDAGEMKSMGEQMESLIAKVAVLEDKLEVATALLEGCSAEVEASKGDDEEGESVINPD